jgi:hypothetical protein
MADLPRILDALGGRGYRAAQLEAGIAFTVVACLSGLTACDPGSGFTVHNPCDAPITVDLRDSDEFKRVGISPVTIEPHSTSSWTQIDPDINAPFGALLLDGPREGELIKSETPDVRIPESACPG